MGLLRVWRTPCPDLYLRVLTFHGCRFVPNAPGALYIPPRIDESNTTWATICRALPPKSTDKLIHREWIRFECNLFFYFYYFHLFIAPALSQMSLTFLLSEVKQKDIPMLGYGVYPLLWKYEVDTFQKVREYRPTVHLFIMSFFSLLELIRSLCWDWGKGTRKTL